MPAPPSVAWWRPLGPLRWLAVVASPLLVATPIFLWFATFRPGITNDFLFYHEAARRFASNPAALYANPNFVYPPPGVLPFLALEPLGALGGYALLSVATVGALLACVTLFARVWERSSGERLGRAEQAALAVAALTAGPVHQTLKLGQVSAFVLLAGLAFLWLVERRPMWAAGALCAGFWLKLYPLVLVPLGLRGVRRSRLFVGLALGLVALPLALFPLVPAELYGDYAARAMRFGQHANVNAMNQGLPAVLARATLPAEAFLRDPGLPLPLFARAAGAAVALGLLAGLLGVWGRGRLSREEAGFGLLATVPTVSTFGWEHAYVLALPLVWWGLLTARRAPPWVQGAALVGALVLLLPKPPHAVVAQSLTWGPRPLHDLFHARFLLVTLGYLAALLCMGWRGEQRGEERTSRMPILPLFSHL